MMVRRGTEPSKGLVVSVRHLPNASATLSAKIVPESATDITAQPPPAIPSAAKHDALSFFNVFGPFGFPMVLIAVICIVWTTFLMVLTIKPNSMANYLMNTAEFDNGTFWLIIEPDITLLVVSVLALGVIAFGYIEMLLQMILLRARKKSSRAAQSPPLMVNVRVLSRLSSIEVVNEQMFHRWICVNVRFGYGSKYWVRCHCRSACIASYTNLSLGVLWQNLWLKSADLTIQTLSLYQLLERGYPQILMYCYAGLVACNAFVYAVGVLFPRYHSAFGDIFMDLMYVVIHDHVSPYVDSH